MIESIRMKIYQPCEEWLDLFNKKKRVEMCERDLQYCVPAPCQAEWPHSVSSHDKWHLIPPSHHISGQFANINPLLSLPSQSCPPPCSGLSSPWSVPSSSSLSTRGSPPLSTSPASPAASCPWTTPATSAGSWIRKVVKRNTSDWVTCEAPEGCLTGSHREIFHLTRHSWTPGTSGRSGLPGPAPGPTSSGSRSPSTPTQPRRGKLQPHSGRRQSIFTFTQFLPLRPEIENQIQAINTNDPLHLDWWLSFQSLEHPYLTLSEISRGKSLQASMFSSTTSIRASDTLKEADSGWSLVWFWREAWTSPAASTPSQWWENGRQRWRCHLTTLPSDQGFFMLILSIIRNNKIDFWQGSFVE